MVDTAFDRNRIYTDGDLAMDLDDDAAIGLDSRESRYAQIVGARLRAVRRQKRLSLQAVEASSAQEFRASVLGAYERGERAISVPRLQRLARLYDVPVDQLLPEGADGRLPAPDSIGPGPHSKIRIDLGHLREARGPEADALARFLQRVQVERGDFNGRVMTIRHDDLRVIGATFGRNVSEMLGALDEAGILYHD
jgi:transcriptional regulator with XRE-family HTH domain